MGKRRHRKRTINRKKELLVNEILAREQKLKRKKIIKDIVHSFRLTDDDRITYIYGQDLHNVIINIVCVSYEIFVTDRWITILRYDNCHGYLHVHSKISLQNDNETVTTDNVRQRGNAKQLLRWAIRDITDKYFVYRKQFMKRSKMYAERI